MLIVHNAHNSASCVQLNTLCTITFVMHVDIMQHYKHVAIMLTIHVMHCYALMLCHCICFAHCALTCTMRVMRSNAQLVHNRALKCCFEHFMLFSYLACLVTSLWSYPMFYFATWSSSCLHLELQVLNMF